ncbi:MAG: AMP-binding protein [Candidatus Binatia bacterium]
MSSPIAYTADALFDLFEALRALYGARGIGVESLAGLAEAARRTVSGDLHPAVLWSLYAADTPDELALVQGRRRFTWSMANVRINRLANALRWSGIEPGDRVAIMLGNSIEWFEAMAACQKIGAATVLVSNRSTAPELRYLLENSQAAAVFFGVESAEMVREAKRELVDDGHAIEVGAKNDGDLAPYDMFLLQGSEDEPPAELRRAGSRTILYTSGTTGKPKGAVRDLSKASVAALAGLLRRVPFRRSDRHLVAAPLYHATASGFATLHLGLGSTLTILERFEPIDFLRSVDQERITTSALVPTMLRTLVDVPAAEASRFDVSSLRILVSTGSTLGESLERAVHERFGDVLYDLYGSTEMGHVTVATPQDKRACPGTIGRPFPGVDVVLLDDQRRPVPEGQIGEVFARSSLTVEGYHGDEAATRQSRHGEYFSGGDLAVRDARGYLKLVGRKTDVIISGGVNLYPAEIEAILAAHPAIREAAIVGKPDEKWGESPVAFVSAEPGAAIPTDEELVEFCKRSLAGYKVPRRFERVEALPRNPTGKVRKHELRARLRG